MNAERTSCACSDCADCCKQQPGFLIPADVARIAEYMKLPVATFALRYLRRSPGAVVGDSQTGAVYRIGTIVPAPDRTGRCVFLDPNDRCLIHPVAPFGCAMFDTHMNEREATRRVTWALREIWSSDDYQTVRAELPEAESYRPFAR